MSTAKFLGILLIIMVLSIVVLLASCKGKGGESNSGTQGNNGGPGVSTSSFIISGSVSGAIKQGVTITLSGTGSTSGTTDASGNYGLTGLANGTYTLTPTITGYTFSPTNQSVSINGASVSAINFTAAANAINPPPAPVASSTLNFSPASLTVSVGNDFILNATIDPGTYNLRATELHINYDQSKFSLNSITCSSSFSNKLYAPPIPTTQDGTARIDCAVPISGASVNSILAIASFSFHAIGFVSNSYIIFTTESMASADGNVGDVVLNMTPALVTVTP